MSIFEEYGAFNEETKKYWEYIKVLIMVCARNENREN